MPIGCVSKLCNGAGSGRVEGILHAISYCLKKFRNIICFSPSIEIRTTVGGIASVLKH